MASNWGMFQNYVWDGWWRRESTRVRGGTVSTRSRSWTAARLLTLLRGMVTCQRAVGDAKDKAALSQRTTSRN